MTDYFLIFWRGGIGKRHHPKKGKNPLLFSQENTDNKKRMIIEKYNETYAGGYFLLRFSHYGE